MTDLGEAQLRALLDATGLAVAACDAEGWLTLLSPALQERFGPFERVHASDFVDRFGLRDPSGTVPLRERDIPLVRALGGEVVRDAIITAVDQAGELLHLRNNAAPVLAADGAVTGAVVLVQDITAEQAAHQDREDLRSRLIETVNHEMRTPLTKLVGHIELLQDAAHLLSPTHQNCLRVMRNAIEELCGTVRTVSELNDLEAHTQLSKTYSDVAELVDAVAREARSFLTQHSRRLIIETPQHLMATLDPVKVRRALLELVHNAATYGPKNSQIRLRTTTHGDSILIQVTDTGSGITTEERDRLIKPFERGTCPRAAREQQRTRPGHRTSCRGRPRRRTALLRREPHRWVHGGTAAAALTRNMHVHDRAYRKTAATM